MLLFHRRCQGMRKEHCSPCTAHSRWLRQRHMSLPTCAIRTDSSLLPLFRGLNPDPAGVAHARSAERTCKLYCSKTSGGRRAVLCLSNNFRLRRLHPYCLRHHHHQHHDHRQPASHSSKTRARDDGRPVRIITCQCLDSDFDIDCMNCESYDPLRT